jgi:hypothetical protein
MRAQAGGDPFERVSAEAPALAGRARALYDNFMALIRR